MAKKYVFVRMPTDVYKMYKGIKIKAENDITKITGKRIPLTMPKVFKMVASPKFNENWIMVDKSNLIKLAREKRK
jgi:hypothetical protein